MGITAESLPASLPGPRSSDLKRPLSLRDRGCIMKVAPDGAVRSFYSLQERRALFGVGLVRIYKLQAGVVVPSEAPDWVFRLSPRSAQMSGRVFEAVEVAQTLEFHGGRSLGYVRKFRVRNSSQAGMALRILQMLDPTAAQFESDSAWGSLGVNAFNRVSHVAMDEVSDPPSARVVGTTPPPTKFYMTANAPRASEVFSSGELPEGTAGMSGQVIILSSHDAELSPGESTEISLACIYNSGKLEDALSDFAQVQSAGRLPQRRHPFIASSQGEVAEAAAWAVPTVEGGVYSGDTLEMHEVMGALSFIDPPSAQRAIAASKSALRKDGSLPHSLDKSKAGVLETALLLQAAATHLVAAQDRKAARAYYPLVKKVAGYLLSSSKGFTVITDASLPQGWRRRLGTGYPTGEVPEVSLAVAEALSFASQVGRMLSKSDDAAAWRERSEMIAERVRKKLLDERGVLALCRDTSGRLRSDDTVDMAVAAYRHPFMASAEQTAVHRLLEKDFDTTFGPRCVPTTNVSYFNGTYGMGQLGGVWTRAVLACSFVCYRAGLPGLGSLMLEKVARMVTEEAGRLGGAPGEFPYWVDVERHTAHGDGSDPVAAARFLQTLLQGELGLVTGPEGVSLKPPESSGIEWVMACDFWAGDPFAAFLGRSSGKVHLFHSGKVSSKQGTKFGKSERIEVTAKGVFGVTFHSPGQVVCLGNSTPSSARFRVAFPAKAVDLSKHLSTPIEEYDPLKGSWGRVGTLRVSPTMTFETLLEPSGWKVFRISTV